MLSFLASMAAFSAGVSYHPEAVIVLPRDMDTQMAETIEIMIDLGYCPHGSIPVRIIAYRITRAAGPEALAEINAVARSAIGLTPTSHAALMIAFLETIHLNNGPGAEGDGRRSRSITVPSDSQYAPAALLH